jgi:ubiquinone/menaquinone biosynthesis C-methylase UbiE
MDLFEGRPKSTYESIASEFEDGTSDFINGYIFEHIDHYLDVLPRNSRILDIGNGTGKYARILNKEGHRTICADSSKGMIKACKRDGLISLVMDFEKPCFQPSTFNAVLAYTSLVHTKKQDFPRTLKEISQMIKIGGIMFVAMKDGKGEGVVQRQGKEHYEARYLDPELREIFSEEFDIEAFTKISASNIDYLNYMLRKINRRGQILSDDCHYG